MKKIGNFVRRTLFKSLSLTSYLSALSKLYFVSFNLGLLKGNPVYAYPHFLQNLINKGDICIDIGANLGYLTTLFAKLVGKEGKVYAVEPVKPIAEVLRKNTRKLKNVKILPYALGETNKPIRLGTNSINSKGFMASGNCSVLEAGATAGIMFDAEMKKGSQLFGQLEKLDFIKCDVEGYEVKVLTELEPVIVKHRPMLLIETRKDNRKKLLRFFEERNFNGYLLENGFLIPATPEDTWDVLIVPVEKETALKPFMRKTTAPRALSS